MEAAEALVWTLVVIAFLFAAGGLVIVGFLIKHLARTNFWLEELYNQQRIIIDNQKKAREQKNAS